MNSTAPDSETSDAALTLRARRDFRERYHEVMALLLVIFSLGVLSNTFLWWYVSEPRPGPTQMQFTAAHPLGDTALCPGDTLRYAIDLHVDGPGVFDLDVAVFRATPPVTVLFSQSRRMVFDSATDYSLERAWTIPPFYSSPIDGSPERWAAGEYERRHAITTVSRNTKPSVVTIPFQVRADCE